jgi:hypothetical protein
VAFCAVELLPEVKFKKAMHAHPFPAGDALGDRKRPPTEAALLCLLRVKCCLLGLHPLYQLLDPIKRSLIGNSGRHVLVMLDLAVEFDALVTHFQFRIRASGSHH